MIPDEGEYCPSCGEPMKDENVEFKSDLVLNTYRTEISCMDCGYYGEIFRLDSTDSQVNFPQDSDHHAI